MCIVLYILLLLLLFVHITLADRCYLCEPRHACLLSISVPISFLAFPAFVHSSAQILTIYDDERVNLGLISLLQHSLLAMTMAMSP